MRILLMKRQAKVRKEGAYLGYGLMPKAKSHYVMSIKPVGVDAVVLSTQHDPDIDQKTLT